MNYLDPGYLEYNDSQILALRLLQAMEYTYLSPKEALKLREGLLSRFVSEEVLAKQFRKLNQIEYNGDMYNFPANTLNLASHDLLMLSKNYEQVITAG